MASDRSSKPVEEEVNHPGSDADHTASIAGEDLAEPQAAHHGDARLAAQLRAKPGSDRVMMMGWKRYRLAS